MGLNSYRMPARWHFQLARRRTLGDRNIGIPSWGKTRISGKKERNGLKIVLRFLVGWWVSPEKVGGLRGEPGCQGGESWGWERLSSRHSAFPQVCGTGAPLIR